MGEKASGPTATEGNDTTVEEDLLLEEISIDGMCGVY
ncbi:mycofactocin precursor MftA [Nocardia wallacei]|nr:mycofactocin precursor MftA [Nocardia wallacei]